MTSVATYQQIFWGTAAVTLAGTVMACIGNLDRADAAAFLGRIGATMAPRDRHHRALPWGSRRQGRIGSAGR